MGQVMPMFRARVSPSFVWGMCARMHQREVSSTLNVASQATWSPEATWSPGVLGAPALRKDVVRYSELVSRSVFASAHSFQEFIWSPSSWADESMTHFAEFVLPEISCQSLQLSL